MLRPATHDDVAGLLRFDMTAVVRTREDWLAAIDKADRGERALLVADLGGDVAAFAQAHHLDEHPQDGGVAGYYLTGVTVLPAYRRTGLARALTAARLDWIAARASTAWYFAAADNTASIRLHEELGFVEFSRAASIHGVSFDAGGGILFRLDLTPPATT